MICPKCQESVIVTDSNTCPVCAWGPLEDWRNTLQMPSEADGAMESEQLEM